MLCKGGQNKQVTAALLKMLQFCFSDKKKEKWPTTRSPSQSCRKNTHIEFAVELKGNVVIYQIL